MADYTPGGKSLHPRDHIHDRIGGLEKMEKENQRMVTEEKTTRRKSHLGLMMEEEILAFFGSSMRIVRAVQVTMARDLKRMLAYAMRYKLYDQRGSNW